MGDTVIPMLKSNTMKWLIIVSLQVTSMDSSGSLEFPGEFSDASSCKLHTSTRGDVRAGVSLGILGQVMTSYGGTPKKGAGDGQLTFKVRHILQVHIKEFER